MGVTSTALQTWIARCFLFFQYFMKDNKTIMVPRIGGLASNMNLTSIQLSGLKPLELNACQVHITS